MQAARFFRNVSRFRLPTRNYSQDVYQKAAMNELPQPQGSWQANYDKNQPRYNRDLAVGIIVTVATLGFGEYMGYHDFWGSPPEKPAQIDSYRQ